jgi:hypothetical protein
MSVCFCRTILALLVIVFAWWNVSWGPIVLTIIGAILAIMALSGNKCCCQEKKQENK